MIKIYFDGACRPNSEGIATYGYVIYQNNKRIARGSGLIGSGIGMTNNVAEYEALLRAIKRFKKLDLKDKLLIKGDSSLVINHLNGKWRCKTLHLSEYMTKIKQLLNGLDYEIMWIPREKNTKADERSKRAYNKYISEDTD